MGAKRSAARLIDLETVRFTGGRWGDGRGLMGFDGFEFPMKKHQRRGEGNMFCGCLGFFLLLSLSGDEHIIPILESWRFEFGNIIHDIRIL